MKAGFCSVFLLFAVSLHASITFDAPGHVFVEKLRPVARGGMPGENFTLTDWRGRSVGHIGTWRVDGTAVLPELPTGYYHLKSDSGNATFAVVPDPESRTFDHDSFYGVDSAQSWVSPKGAFLCPWNGGDTFRTVSDLVRLAGVPHVRDRLRWRDVNPRPRIFAYAGSDYMYNADLLKERDILLSGMFHDAPKWSGVLKKMPSDLGTLFSFCRKTAQMFGDRMGDWEFWNEPDIGFAPEPVWDYAAALKAAYLGFKAGRQDVTVLPAALCHLPDCTYERGLYANDAAKFCDALNYHSYHPIARYPEILSAMRAFFSEYGLENKALWITESGTNMEGLGDLDSIRKGLKAHSPRQELVLAEFYPKSQIALQMEGVARNYYFIFGAMNERNGAKDWGVLRRDGTVKPVYAAISAMTRELVSARLKGEISAGKDFRVYLFEQPDGSQTIAYWSTSPMDTNKTGRINPDNLFLRELHLSVTNGVYLLSDMCGTRSVVPVTNGVLRLESTRYPSYLAGVRGLTVDKPSRDPGVIKPYVPSVNEDMSVILRADLNTDDFSIANKKTLAVMKGSAGRLKLQIWNMDDCIKTGRVCVSGVKVSGLPDEALVLGPRGTHPLTLDCTVMLDNVEEFHKTAVFTGIFNCRSSSRLAIPIRFEKIIDSACDSVPLNCMDPKFWERNTSAQSYRVSWDENEQAVRFDFGWTDPKTDRWFYPVYDLELPAESLDGALWLEFEVKTWQNKPENDFFTQLLMLEYADPEVPVRNCVYQSPIGNWEKRSVTLNASYNLSKVTRFRLGANPRGTQCTFWLRNIRLMKPKKVSNK